MSAPPVVERDTSIEKTATTKRSDDRNSQRRSLEVPIRSGSFTVKIDPGMLREGPVTITLPKNSTMSPRSPHRSSVSITRSPNSTSFGRDADPRRRGHSSPRASEYSLNHSGYLPAVDRNKDGLSSSRTRHPERRSEESDDGQPSYYPYTPADRESLRGKPLPSSLDTVRGRRDRYSGRPLTIIPHRETTLVDPLDQRRRRLNHDCRPGSLHDPPDFYNTPRHRPYAGGDSDRASRKSPRENRYLSSEPLLEEMTVRRRPSSAEGGSFSDRKHSRSRLSRTQRNSAFLSVPSSPTSVPLRQSPRNSAINLTTVEEADRIDEILSIKTMTLNSDHIQQSPTSDRAPENAEYEYERRDKFNIYNQHPLQQHMKTQPRGARYDDSSDDGTYDEVRSLSNHRRSFHPTRIVHRPRISAEEDRLDANRQRSTSQNARRPLRVISLTDPHTRTSEPDMHFVSGSRFSHSAIPYMLGGSTFNFRDGVELFSDAEVLEKEIYNAVRVFGQAYKQIAHFPEPDSEDDDEKDTRSARERVVITPTLRAFQTLSGQAEQLFLDTMDRVHDSWTKLSDAGNELYKAQNSFRGGLEEIASRQMFHSDDGTLDMMMDELNSRQDQEWDGKVILSDKRSTNFLSTLDEYCSRLDGWIDIANGLKRNHELIFERRNNQPKTMEQLQTAMAEAGKDDIVADLQDFQNHKKEFMRDLQECSIRLRGIRKRSQSLRESLMLQGITGKQLSAYEPDSPWS